MTEYLTPGRQKLQRKIIRESCRKFENITLLVWVFGDKNPFICSKKLNFNFQIDMTYYIHIYNINSIQFVFHFFGKSYLNLKLWSKISVLSSNFKNSHHYFKNPIKSNFCFLFDFFLSYFFKKLILWIYFTISKKWKLKHWLFYSKFKRKFNFPTFC